MQVKVTYDKFNTGIEKAEIPVGEEEKFELGIVEENVGELENTVLVRMLELKSVDATDSEISLKMTFEEAKSFNLLVNQLLKTL